MVLTRVVHRTIDAPGPEGKQDISAAEIRMRVHARKVCFDMPNPRIQKISALPYLMLAATSADAQGFDSGSEYAWLLITVASMFVLAGVFIAILVGLARNQRTRRRLRRDRQRVLSELRGICHEVEKIRQNLQEAGLDDGFAGLQSARYPAQSRHYHEQMTELQKQLGRLRGLRQHFAAHPNTFPNGRSLHKLISNIDHFLAGLSDEFEQNWPSIGAANEGVDRETLVHLRRYTSADRSEFDSHFIAPSKRLIRMVRSNRRTGRTIGSR